MKKHGDRTRKGRTKEYAAWDHMIQRCTNQKHPYYKDYGGRGISVCERWFKYENFLADVGRAPSRKLSIDRYPNNNGNYEPGNIRWATNSEQLKNRRPRLPITYNGETRSLEEWSRELKILPETIRHRYINGRDIGVAMRKKEKLNSKVNDGNKITNETARETTRI